MLLKERIIGGPTGGIPESAISTMGNSIIPGLSGETKIHRIVSPDVFYFADATVHGFGFQAWVTDGYLYTEARTRGWQNDPNRRHPDIYTRLLTQAAKKHYLDQGKEIKGYAVYLDGKGTLTDVYNQYVTSLKSQADPASNEAKIAAVTHTRSSITAASLGFTRVHEVQIDQENKTVEIFFTSPPNEQ